MLKLTGGRAGVDGAALMVLDANRLVTYLLLFMGTKIPEPAVLVVKYLRPSTSPLFFPRLACSKASSMPANFPGFPATVPKYFTVPCIPPGTLTRSPIWISSRDAIVAVQLRGTGGVQGLRQHERRKRSRIIIDARNQEIANTSRKTVVLEWRVRSQRVGEWRKS